MRKLLSADLYKLYRNQTFWLCTLIAAGLGVYMLIVDNTMNAPELVHNQLSANAKNIGWALTQNISDVVILLFSVPVSIFVASEFHGGTMKNIVTKGFGRTRIYFSKLLVSLLMMIFMFLTFMLASMVTGGILWGFTMNAAMLVKILQYIGLQLLSGCALACVYVAVAILIQNSAVVIAANLLLTLMGKFPVWIVDTIMGKGLNNGNYYWLVNNIMNFKTPSPAVVDMQRMIVVSLGYMICFVITGCTVLRYRDSK